MPLAPKAPTHFGLFDVLTFRAYIKRTEESESRSPNIQYWYHGELMAQMMILSWSGTRLQHVINDENYSFFHQERNKALAMFRSHGVIHSDDEWRNMLWMTWVTVCLSLTWRT
ncbi:hypothetical protein N7471_010750 [Penicillium samsonianum]|uniref:uncharacterized protein n=1 Tax=Penicillium samsonianum TaxID=1882272 RepID=UPI0025471D63|nr:uncharacterized protein N7471_010750 [Penicillium samsonianum]KAJ6126257.1 hypothetical protein N7471_010750 [Penicillium samsonianum]